MCIRAVERAAKDNPRYLETTYRDARNQQWIASPCGQNPISTRC